MAMPVFMEILRQAGELGGKEIDITGGEPFTHPKIWTILKNTSSSGFDVSLATNGTLCTKQDARRLSEMNIAFTMVSIHGGEIEHDNLTRAPNSWRRALGWISAARIVGLEFGLNVYLRTPTGESATELIQLAVTENIKRIRFLYHCPTGRGEHLDVGLDYDPAWWKMRLAVLSTLRSAEHEELTTMITPGVWPSSQVASLSTERRSYFCNLDENFSGVVGPGGSTYPCCSLYGNDLFLLGEFPTQSLKQLRSQQVRAFSEYFSHLPVECLNCKHSSYCRGGCPAFRVSSAQKDRRCKEDSFIPLCPAAHEHLSELTD